MKTPVGSLQCLFAIQLRGPLADNSKKIHNFNSSLTALLLTENGVKSQKRKGTAEWELKKAPSLKSRAKSVGQSVFNNL